MAERAPTNIRSRLETSAPLLTDLIADIRNGQIKIPQFQRPFVWKAAQALELLDSISRNYPIGSLLLWRTTSKLATERNIGDFRLPETDDHSPTDYVLDGQQRLTVIYSCLGAPANEPGFAAAYDIDTQTFVESNTSPPKACRLPLRWLFGSTELLEFRTSLRGLPRGTDLLAILDELHHVFQNYRIPTVLLKELTVEEVCPIFERINSSGTHLDIYDLMVAATWSSAFDLNKKTEEIRGSLQGKDFENIGGTTILKCLAAIATDSIKKKDLLGLRDLTPTRIDAAVQTTKESLLRAVDTLATEFGVYSWDFLPYESVVVILAYLHARIPSLNGNHVRRIRQWFWRSSFAERYRVGGENFVTNDLLAVLTFVQGSADDPDDFGEVPTEKIWQNSIFRSNNSRSRAFVLALARHKPRNLTNGALIDSSVALSAWNKKEFHHIYPKAFLKRKSTTTESNLLSNICLLASSENKRISDDNPQEYLPRLASGFGKDATDIFLSNLLPLPDRFDYRTKEYSDFLQERSKILSSQFARLCEGDV